jgi:hypothetical protein
MNDQSFQGGKLIEPLEASWAEPYDQFGNRKATARLLQARDRWFAGLGCGGSDYKSHS